MFIFVTTAPRLRRASVRRRHGADVRHCPRPSDGPRRACDAAPRGLERGGPCVVHRATKTAVHGDGDDGPVERKPMVLNVLSAQQGVARGDRLAPGWIRPGRRHEPPQLGPASSKSLDEHANRGCLDIGQPRSRFGGLNVRRRRPCTVASAVVVHREHHGHHVGAPSGPPWRASPQATRRTWPRHRTADRSRCSSDCSTTTRGRGDQSTSPSGGNSR